MALRIEVTESAPSTTFIPASLRITAHVAHGEHVQHHQDAPGSSDGGAALDHGVGLASPSMISPAEPDEAHQGQMGPVASSPAKATDGLPAMRGQPCPKRFIPAPSPKF